MTPSSTTWFVMGVILLLCTSIGQGKRVKSSEELMTLNDDIHRIFHDERDDRLISFDEDIEAHVYQCEDLQCKHGQECIVNVESSQPECVCITQCKNRFKPVCGSDGVHYPNHCQLHRQACLMGVSITVDHSNTCLREPTTPAPISVSGPLSVETDETVNDTPNPSDDDDDRSIQECSIDLISEYKSDVLHYYQNRLGVNPQLAMEAGVSTTKLLVTLLFSYYDTNQDNNISLQELEEFVTETNDIDLTGCTLFDLMTFDDINKDSIIDTDEFYHAFGVPVLSLAPNLRDVVTTATVGRNVALKCGIVGDPKPSIVWMRNNIDLSTIDTNDIRVLDGVLFISPTATVHSGNYSCLCPDNTNIIQNQQLDVHLVPSVQVCPRSIHHIPGSSLEFQCRAEGYPQPGLVWLKRGHPINTHNSRHYSVIDEGKALHISQLEPDDTAPYSCVAENSVGSDSQTVSLFVDSSIHNLNVESNHLFFIFHDLGILVLEPSTCETVRRIPAGLRVASGHSDLCVASHTGNRICSWGSAIRVRDRFIYVSQPLYNRVLTIDITTREVVQVINTDPYPVSVQYVPYLDQVWILCWRNMTTEHRTVQVIHKASASETHYTVHTQPIGHHFDTVSELLLPTVDNFKFYNYPHGYIVIPDHTSLYRINLANLHFEGFIDLSDYNCVPKNVAFVPLGGIVVVNCDPDKGELVQKSQLVLDYVTGSVVRFNRGVTGRPLTSPDSQYVVSIDDYTGDIKSQIVSSDGNLKSTFEIQTNQHVSTLSFYRSTTSRSYDIFISSKDKSSILYIDLSVGRVQMITGIGQPTPERDWPWDSANRNIINSGEFGEYLVTPSQDSAVVVDGDDLDISCRLHDVVHGNVIVWVGC